MAQRQLVIASSPLCGKQVPVRVHITVDDHAPIGILLKVERWLRCGYTLIGRKHRLVL